MKATNLRTAWCIITVCSFTIACSCSHKPFINSFSVTPRTITADDSVRINWEVSGTPTLMFHERQLSDSLKLLEFTLVVQKNGKDSSRIAQVEVHQQSSATDIVIATTSLSANRDTIIATGEKSSRWSSFKVVDVSSGSGRELYVTHDGKTATLLHDGGEDNTFMNTEVAGTWTIKALLTADEKRDIKTAPKELQIHATIKSKK